MKSQHPTARNARPYRTPPSVLNDSIIRDGAVVCDQSNVRMKQARLEIRQREHRVYRLPRYCQRILPPVDATRPAELNKVRRDNLPHAPLVKARFLTPKFLFEV